MAETTHRPRPIVERQCKVCGWVGQSTPYRGWCCRPCTNLALREAAKISGWPKGKAQADRSGAEQEQKRQYWRDEYHRRAQALGMTPKRKAAPREQKRARLRLRYAWLKSGDVTSQQLKEIWKRDGGRCRYCRVEVNNPRFLPWRLHGFDHVIPQSKGGQNTYSNLVVCCLPCNRQKHNRLAEPLPFDYFWRCSDCGAEEYTPWEIPQGWQIVGTELDVNEWTTVCERGPR